MAFAIGVAMFFYVAVLVCFALLTYAFFWYETVNGPHLAHLRQLPGGRPGRWMARGLISSFISQNLVVLLYPLSIWRGLWQPTPDPACPRPPVILIHGLYHNVSAWLVYRWLLRRKGFRNTYAFGYSSFHTDLHNLLHKLDQQVVELQRRLPHQRVVLVGHSLGGLLARAYVERPENAPKVAAVVTLGSPHQGSKLAAFGVGRLARSIVYQGSLFAELAHRATPCELPRLAIYSPLDNMVLPNESLRALPAGWSHFESQPLSHVAMLYHLPLARMVVEYVQLRALSRQGEHTGERRISD